MVLGEARRLHALGMGILWLRAKQKIPVESGWTTGPRKEWAYLESTYREGYNVGVRLGESSKIGEGYLAAIDIDIKVFDKKLLLDAIGQARKILGDLGPCALSGRGNGSRHYYFLTKEPFKTFYVVKNEKYEISLFSKGRQIVIPPSVHPVTGKEYRWLRPFVIAELPLIVDTGNVETAPKGEKIVLQDFKVEPVLDFAWIPISDEVREGIRFGRPKGTQSEFLYRAWHALRNAGLSQNETVSVLLNPDHLISKAVQERRPASLSSQAQWLIEYTGKSAEASMSTPEVFSGKNIEPPRELLPEEIQAEEKESEEAQKAQLKVMQERGFYTTDHKGKLIPAYNALLSKFRADHDYRSIADMKAVYVFNGTHYESITPIEIRAFAERYFSPKPLNRTRSEFFDKVLVNNVTNRQFFIGTTEGKINFKNGILDLVHAGLLPHSSDIGFRGVLPYEYLPEAECPVFKNWISSVMLGDRALIAILQEFMGYIVRGGEYLYHKALWLEGTGRNGKSTFIDVLKALIGPSNFSTLSIKSLMNDKFSGSDLDGKIANFSEETSPQELADSGPFKNLTGDGDMSAQKKFGDIYSFRNRAKLVMSYNQIPDLKDLSPGMLSRPIIVPFRKEIKEAEQDRGIKKKLFKELPGIFNFALDGWRRLESQNGFTSSKHSARALRKIKHESCNVRQWIENYVIFTKDKELKKADENSGKVKRVSELYSAYKANVRYAYGISAFGRKLNEHPRMKIRHKHNRNGSLYWGLILR
jgi:putative DNA primase/helicase